MRGFREILDGEHDDVPEGAFYMKGGIDQVMEEVRGSAKRSDDGGAKAEEEDDDEVRTGEEDEGSESEDSEGQDDSGDDDE